MIRKKAHKRPLTQAEIALVRPLFKESIDYKRVLVYNKKYLPFNLQNDNMVMAPNGNIYFPDRLYRDDYALENARLRHLFVHEMSHVWQNHIGYSVTIKGFFLHLEGMIKKCNPYSYTLHKTSVLSDFNLEQQADIIADYFSYFHDTAVGFCASDSGHHYQNCKNCYLDVLVNFINNPSCKTNVPK